MAAYIMAPPEFTAENFLILAPKVSYLRTITLPTSGQVCDIAYENLVVGRINGEELPGYLLRITDVPSHAGPSRSAKHADVSTVCSIPILWMVVFTVISCTSHLRISDKYRNTIYLKNSGSRVPYHHARVCELFIQYACRLMISAWLNLTIS